MIGAQVALGLEEFSNMKNTGKRIFAAVVLLALLNVPALVLAGHLSSSR